MLRKLFLIIGLFTLLAGSADALVGSHRVLLHGGNGSSGGNAPLSFLRVATPVNSVMNAAGLSASGTQDNFVFTIPFEIGQIACSDLVFSFNTWGTTNAGDTNTGNAVTILDAAVFAGSAISQVKFSGSAGATVADNTVDFQSDALPPLSGKTKYSQSETYYLKLRVSIPATTGKLPYAINGPGASVTNWQADIYDPAVTTPSSTLAAGVYTFTGTAPGAQVAQYKPIILCHPYNDAISLIAVGDSEISSLTDTGNATLLNGNGYFQRGLTALDGVSNPRPSMNFSLAGNATAAWTGTNIKWTNYIKYANVGFNGLGTNDINGSLTFDQATSLQRYVIQYMRSGGIKRQLRPELFPNTTSSDNFATVVNQTGQAGWTPGAVAPQVITWFSTKLNDGLYQAVASASDLRDATTTTAWEAGSVTTATGNVTIGSGSANLNAVAATFTSGDVGKSISVPGAGAAGGVLNSYVLTFTDATHVVLVNTASTALTSSLQTIAYGQPTPDGKHPTTLYHIIHGTTLRNVLATFPTVDPTPSVLPPVLNPYDAEANISLSNGNLTATGLATVSHSSVRGTTGVSSGKYYWEVTLNSGTAVEVLLSDLTGDLSTDNNAHVLNYNTSGGVFFNGSLGSMAPFTTGNTVCVGLDATNGLIAFKVGNGNWNNNVANNPATGAFSIFATGKFSAGTVIYPGIQVNNAASSASIKFSGFSFSVPTGYSAITGGGV